MKKYSYQWLSLYILWSFFHCHTFQLAYLSIVYDTSEYKEFYASIIEVIVIEMQVVSCSCQKCHYCKILALRNNCMFDRGELYPRNPNTHFPPCPHQTPESTMSDNKWWVWLFNHPSPCQGRYHHQNQYRPGKPVPVTPIGKKTIIYPIYP